MRVALISYTPNPELAVAARVSYSSSTVNELREKLTPEQAGNLPKQLLSAGHLSPIGKELNPKCYRLGYCDESESCGLFPTRKPDEAQINN